MQHGFILTNAPSLDSVEDIAQAGRYTTMKVVPTWGLDSGWSCETRGRLIGLTQQTVLRTRAGDPSSGHIYPHSEEVLQEVAPWASLRRSLLVEIGNEPNATTVKVDPFDYAWYLVRSIKALKETYPNIKIIGTAMQPGPTAERWYTILAEVLRSCDAVAFHAYGHENFTETGHLAEATRIGQKFFAKQPWWLTESLFRK